MSNPHNTQPPQEETLQHLKFKVEILTRLFELLEKELKFKNDLLKEYEALVLYTQGIPSLN